MHSTQAILQNKIKMVVQYDAWTIFFFDAANPFFEAFPPGPGFAQMQALEPGSEQFVDDFRLALEEVGQSDDCKFQFVFEDYLL